MQKLQVSEWVEHDQFGSWFNKKRLLENREHALKWEHRGEEKKKKIIVKKKSYSGECKICGTTVTSSFELTDTMFKGKWVKGCARCFLSSI